MSAEFCCGIKSSDFNCSCATSGFLMLNNRSKNGGWHLFRCLDCFILLLPMFLVFSLLLFYLKPNLEFFGLRTLNPGWQGLGFAFSEAMNLNESLYLFRDAKCPLWDQDHSLHWTDLLVTHWKGKGHPYSALSQWAGSTRCGTFQCAELCSGCKSWLLPHRSLCWCTWFAPMLD